MSILPGRDIDVPLDNRHCAEEREFKEKPYGRTSADRTEHGNDVIFFVLLAAVFGNLEV